MQERLDKLEKNLAERQTTDETNSIPAMITPKNGLSPQLDFEKKTSMNSESKSPMYTLRGGSNVMITPAANLTTTP